MQLINYLKLTIFLLIISEFAIAQQNDNVKIWYNKPAEKWESEALPIGNGRLGAMIFGGTSKDYIQFNEQSLWSGDNNWDGAYETGDHGFGSYRNFGEIKIEFSYLGEPENYTRELDLINGIHSTKFKLNGIAYTREAFASYPGQVMVFTYKASKKGVYSGKISMISGQGAECKAEKNQLSFVGEMPNELKHAAILVVKSDGGTLSVDGNVLKFENCNALTLFLNAGTNYKPDYESNWRGTDPYPVIEQALKKVLTQKYSDIRKAHVNDFSALMGRVAVNWGTTDSKLLALPVDQRLKLYAKVDGTVKESKGHEVVAGAFDNIKKVGEGTYDPDLEQLIFQYGRYLLASCSRPGGLPANLQGLWNEKNDPAWASDYHTNINIQMNYWAAETANLSECHLPLIDFIIAASEPCRIATRKAFGEKMRGWTARTSMNIFGGNGWEWNIPASAWLAQHVYEHWAFTRDNQYLKNTAYPVIKEICEFWEDNLKKQPDGTLVVPNGWSPEHGPREDGIMHDQQIVWDLFENYLDVARALNIDMDYQQKISDMQSKLAGNKIGKWGQLQEWQVDRDDPDDQHRHTSHLFAVYPGRQISTTLTPDLARAAILSLRSRSGNYGKNMDKPFTVESTVGDSRRSWTWPWRCALWARLGEGAKAGIMVRGLLTYNTLPNLFCNHPPFQLDGNFGMPAAMIEMLMQSHTGVIQLLPALPETWAKKGYFKGFCARGGYVVDCEWKDGKVTSYAVKSTKQEKVKIMIDGKVLEIKTIRIKK